VSAATPAHGRAASLLVSAAFAAAIAAPMVATAISGGASDASRTELRALAPEPRAPRTLAEALAWPARFEAWYGDHFGLRQRLLRQHNLAKWEFFGVSPTERFVRGRDGWVFLDENGSLDSFRGVRPWPAPRLAGWVRMLEARAAWLRERGIAHVFALAPSKEQVYDELVPSDLTRAGPSRLDELAEALLAHRDVPFVDLRTALRAERVHDGERGEDDLVYFRLGTHWTDRGAYAACAAIADALRERSGVSLALPRREDFFVAALGEGDSLAKQLYMERELAQIAWRWKMGAARRAQYDDAQADHAPEWTSECDAAEPRGLVLHDSFGTSVRVPLAECFSRATFVWGWGFDVDRIERERPDVVIELFTDRALLQSPPDLSRIEDPALARARFEAATPIERFDEPSIDSGWRPHERTELAELAGEDGPGLRVSAERRQPGVVTPRIDFPRDTAAILRLDVTSPRERGVEVYYEKRREPGFDRRNSCFGLLPAGRSQVTVEILDADLAGALLLRFSERGEYLVHALEVRAVRDR
jgi:hypothetical protein